MKREDYSESNAKNQKEVPVRKNDVDGYYQDPKDVNHDVQSQNGAYVSQNQHGTQIPNRQFIPQNPYANQMNNGQFVPQNQYQNTPGGQFAPQNQYPNTSGGQFAPQNQYPNGQFAPQNQYPGGQYVPQNQYPNTPGGQFVPQGQYMPQGNNQQFASGFPNQYGQQTQSAYSDPAKSQHHVYITHQSQPQAQPLRMRTEKNPGVVYGAIGFLLCFLSFSGYWMHVTVVAVSMLLSIVFSSVGSSKSQAAGWGNGLATAGFVISVIHLVLFCLALAIVVFSGGDVLEAVEWHSFGYFL